MLTSNGDRGAAFGGPRGVGGDAAVRSRHLRSDAGHSQRTDVIRLSHLLLERSL